MVNMFHTCLDDTLQHLSNMEKNPLLHYDLLMYQSLRVFQAELRMFRILSWCIPDYYANMLDDLNFIAASFAKMFRFEEGTDFFSQEFREKRRKCRAKVNEDHYYQQLISLHSFQGEPFTTNNDAIEFLDSVHVIFNYILKCKNKRYLYRKIQSLVESLSLLRNLVYFTNPQTDFALQIFVHDWANKVGCLSVLLGLTELHFGSERLYDHLQQIVNPDDPNFIKLCFQVIKVPKMKPEDRLLFGEFVSSFVDFFLENLMLVLKDDVQMIREGLIFVLTFLSDPPENTLNHSELMPLVREQIYSILDQASDNMCFLCETNTELYFSRGKTRLDDFLKSINELREDIVNLYVHIPTSLWTNFPRINSLGYFQCLLAYLENLEETMNNDRKLVPFLKHKIFTIHQELLPLKVFMQDTWPVKNEQGELKDIWEQITSLLYQADFAIKSSFFTDDPIWYNLTCLSKLVREIKDIQLKVVNIQFETQTVGSHISKTEAIQPLMSSFDVPKPSTSTSNVEVVVGFENEIKLVIDRLIYGSKRLHIVSIVGMGGIGKTTLAKILYNKLAVKNHFHKRAFCSVSQVYRKRNVLLGILSDASQIDDRIRRMSDDDLANCLRQSLLGCRYLIILDDIWDNHVWKDLRDSFPDDGNGSRVLFTTRINSISLTARPDSTLCELPLLSNDESWELLKQKVFYKDPCPHHLLDTGMLIAQKCKGLPLAIVVIAGLLAKTERSLTSWNEVAKTLSSFASIEGCGDIIKLSYKHLPEALKSCFLYLGALKRGYTTDASVLERLWIAEGFVLDSGNSSVDEIAKNYLNDLGDRNLITVTLRSLNGTIKRFRVHDLIHDFCRTEAGEEHYLCYINDDNKNLLLMSSLLPQYRICIEAEWRFKFDAKPRGHTLHSLLYNDDTASYAPKVSVEGNSIQSFLFNFKLVELLHIKDFKIDGEFPMILTTLVHLRYLALRFSAKVHVPPDIINLWNLETFILWASEILGMHISLNGDWVRNSGAMETNHFQRTVYRVDFPNNIWRMKRLRHVQVDGDTHVGVDDDVTGVFSPLPDLIRFGHLFVPCGEEGEQLLTRLANVRNFSCNCSGRWDPDRKCNVLPKLEFLMKLEILLMVHKGKARPPYIFSFPSTIRELSLENFGLPWNEFSAIMGMLPCLDVLQLHVGSFIGESWNVEEDEKFPKIKSLELHHLDIEEWNVSVNSFPFPSMEKLSVKACRKLIEIPLYFSEVVTLMYICVDTCKKSVADSAIQIQENQSETGNDSFKVELFGIRT